MSKKRTSQASVKMKTISPFKDKGELEKEITNFINKFRATVVNQASRISDYFEMSCFNYIVRFYELNGYSVSVQNLQSGKYRYKCSPAGVQTNYSFFCVSKTSRVRKYCFEIQHNIAVQSSHHSEVFTNPDIAVIRAGSAKTTTSYYDTKRRFSYVANKDLVSFYEVKHFNPFPELIFNFIGVVNEVQKEVIINSAKSKRPIHLAPSLMISGKPNKQTLRIKESLESRYCINIIFDLFDSGLNTFSKNMLHQLKTTGRNK